MKKYNVTVNGTTYEVMVEETGEVASAAPTVSAAPAAAPAAASAPKPAAAPAAAQGRVKVTAPMPGTILRLNVKVGDVIEANALVCVLEAMKMENEIFAAEGGTVKSVNVSQGDSVGAGDVIVTLG